MLKVIATQGVFAYHSKVIKLSISTNMVQSVLRQKLHSALQRLLTALFGKFAYCRSSWLKNRLIQLYMFYYRIDLSEAEYHDYRQYEHFNHFFTRKLQAKYRPFSPANSQLICPVDGCMYQFGRIEKTQFNVKGLQFTLPQLLTPKHPKLNEFSDGQFFSMYLSPKDYHRVHMPMDGLLKHTLYVPGQLFSVNPSNLSKQPDIFARNERLICLFDTPHGEMCIIFVAAMIVGQISTAWAGVVNKNHQHQILEQDYQANPIKINKGEDMGHFQMGSSILVLFANPICQWDPSLDLQQDKRWGENIATLS
jgi:phosphatidylserine decarboxylase